MAYLQAREPFFVGNRYVRGGQVIDSDDPIVKGREAFFVPLDVEQATARPGERRNVAIPPANRKPKTHGGLTTKGLPRREAPG